MSRWRWMLTFDSQQLFMLGKPRTIITLWLAAAWTAADLAASVSITETKQKRRVDAQQA